MRLKIGLLSVAAAWPLLCLAEDGPAAPAQTLTIRTRSPGAFEVVYHRVDANMAGAAFAGLIGAAIQGGAQASQDETKTKQVLPKLTDPSCSKPLVEAMASKLKEAGFALNTTDAGPGPVAVLDIEECSLRLVDTSQLQMASFVTLNVQYELERGKRPAWTEKIQITGKNRHSFDAFVAEPGLAQTEFVEVLTRAGGRAANKIIYRNGGNS